MHHQQKVPLIFVAYAETTGLFLDDYYKATENINAFDPTRADANTIANENSTGLSVILQEGPGTDYRTDAIEGIIPQTPEKVNTFDEKSQRFTCKHQ